MDNDLRWQQRFQNFEKAFEALQRRIDEYEQYPNIEAYQMALISSFIIMYELSWNILKDYLQNEGVDVKNSPRNVFRSAFQNELIFKIEPWMESIVKRNDTVHAYHEDTLRKVIQFITETFYPIVRDLYFQLKKEL